MHQKIALLRAEIAERQKTLLILMAEVEASGEPAPTRPAFDKATLDNHKAQRTPTFPYWINLPLRAHLSGPFVYGMVVPIAFLDLCLVIFQAVCFRLWGVGRVRRSQYVVVDRQHLAYLNGIEKLNCIYCGYANGVFAFARELAARTEQYWCPIKHAIKTRDPHHFYEDFAEFGDADAWKDHPARKKLKK